MSAIDERYVDAFGVERIVPQTTRDAFLALVESAVAHDAIVPPATVRRIDVPIVVVVTLPAQSWTERLSWTLHLEDGSEQHGACELRDAPVVETYERSGERYDRRAITLNDVPLGYHQVTVDAAVYGTARGALIVAPPAAFLAPHGRQWGIAVQLYTIRSTRNWGIGDFTDLCRFIEFAADAGADYVGLNPLHAPHRNNPDAASPYAPTSRRYLNWLYIDIDAIPESSDPGVREIVDAPDFRARLETLRASSIVDYIGVAYVKDTALRRCFSALRARPHTDPAFAEFMHAGGTALERFAIFETLVERLGRDVAAWPATYRDPATDDVRSFASTERIAIEYSMYLQYHAARQLEAAAQIARTRGIAIYRDLAVGVDVNGADVWIDPPAYIPSVSVGAPPDLLNPDGQDWGLPPLHPRGLALDGYRAFAELCRANMECAGALRIDHVMSLARLFWSPRGRSALEGTYVAYPLDDLLGVLALESVRAGCSIIGEDLGTVPIGFRERMTAAQVLSYRILFFERERDGGFIPAEHYPALSLAATGTHDLATFEAWLSGADIELRAGLGVGDPARIPQEHAERDADRRRLIATLRQSGDLERDEPAAVDVMIAAHRFLARSPARIVMMQVDDAIGETLPINVPGTWDQYPNWRRKLRLDLGEIARDDRFAALCGALRASRPRNG